MGSVKLILKAVNQWNCAPGPTEPTILEGAGKTFDVLLKDQSAPVP